MSIVGQFNQNLKVEKLTSTNIFSEEIRNLQRKAFKFT